MNDQQHRSVAERVSSLSGRQKEVLRLVSRDHGSKEIARELGLSEETVKNHVKAAMRKLGVGTRYDAARLVRLHEEHDPRVVIDPSRVIAGGQRAATTRSEHGDHPSNRAGDVLREERATFDAGTASVFLSEETSTSPSTEEAGRNGLTPLQVFGWVAVTTAALAIAGVAAAPLAQSIQNIANIIEEPKQPN